MSLGQINNGSSILLENQVADANASLPVFQNAMDGLAQPHWIDAIFPVFAFLMVIVLPSTIALWVIYKTVREKNCKEDQTSI